MTLYVRERDPDTIETRSYFARKVQHRGGLGWECRRQRIHRLQVVPALARLDRLASFLHGSAPPADVIGGLQDDDTEPTGVKRVGAC